MSEPKGCRRRVLDKVLKLAKSPGFRKTAATLAASAGYVGLGEAGYQPGVDTSAGLDAEQIRLIVSGLLAVAGYLLPAGFVGVVTNWSHILGKRSSDRIDALTLRVESLENASKGTP